MIEDKRLFFCFLQSLFILCIKSLSCYCSGIYYNRCAAVTLFKKCIVNILTKLQKTKGRDI